MARLSKDARTSRRQPLSAWSRAYLAVVLALLVLAWFGVYDAPWWVSALVWAPLVWVTFRGGRRTGPSWRRTDSRTTDGDRRGLTMAPSWVKDQPCQCAGPGRCDGSCHLI